MFRWIRILVIRKRENKLLAENIWYTNSSSDLVNRYYKEL